MCCYDRPGFGGSIGGPGGPIGGPGGPIGGPIGGLGGPIGGPLGPGGPFGPIRPGGPNRRPHHSAANGVLVGPGGPIDPIPGQKTQNTNSNNNQAQNWQSNNVAAASTQNAPNKNNNPNCNQTKNCLYKIVAVRTPNGLLNTPIVGKIIRPVTRQTNRQQTNGGGLAYRVVNHQQNPNRPGSGTYRVFEAGVQRPSRSSNGGGGNAFKLFLSYMS